jgi:Fe-S cluster assembly iron-binding protein IscA
MAIHITQAAASQLSARVVPGHMLRISVSTGGSSGLRFGFTVVEDSYRGDQVLHIGLTTIVIDQFGLPYIRGRTLDWVNGAFVF